MRLIETTSLVPIVELNSEDSVVKAGGEQRSIAVKPHWNLKRLVVLEIDGNRYTVDCYAMRRAIANAENAHAY